MNGGDGDIAAPRWPPVGERTPELVQFIAEKGADATTERWHQDRGNLVVDDAINEEVCIGYFELVDTLLKPTYDLVGLRPHTPEWETLLAGAFPKWNDTVHEEMVKVITTARQTKRPGLLIFVVKKWIELFRLEQCEGGTYNSQFMDAMWCSILGAPQDAILSTLPLKRFDEGGLEAINEDVVRNACNARMNQLTQLRDELLESAKNATPTIGTGDEAASINHNNWIGILTRDLNKCAVVINRGYQIIVQTLCVVQDKSWIGAGDAPTKMLRALESDKTRKAHLLVREMKSIMLTERYRRRVEPTKTTVWKQFTYTERAVVYWIRLDRLFALHQDKEDLSSDPYPMYENGNDNGPLNPLLFQRRTNMESPPVTPNNDEEWSEMDIQTIKDETHGHLLEVKGNTISTHLCGGRSGDTCYERTICLENGKNVRRPCCCFLHTWCGQPFLYDVFEKCNLCKGKPIPLSEAQVLFEQYKKKFQMMPGAESVVLDHAFSFKREISTIPRCTQAYVQHDKKTMEELVYHMTSEYVNLELSQLVESEDKVRQEAIKVLTRDTLDDNLVLAPDETLLVFNDGILVASLDLLHRLGEDEPVFLCWDDSRLALSFIRNRTTIRKFDDPFRPDELAFEMRAMNLFRYVSQTRSVFPGTHLDPNGVKTSAAESTDIDSVYTCYPKDRQDYCACCGMHKSLCVPFTYYLQNGCEVMHPMIQGHEKRRKLSSSKPVVNSAEFYAMMSDWICTTITEEKYNWNDIKNLCSEGDENGYASSFGEQIFELIETHELLDLQDYDYLGAHQAVHNAIEIDAKMHLTEMGLTESPMTFSLPHQFSIDLRQLNTHKELMRKAAAVPTFALDSIFIPQLEKLGNRQEHDGLYTDNHTKFTDTQIALDMEQYYFVILMLTGRYLFEQGRHDSWQVFLYLLGANQSGKTTFQECLGEFFHASEKGYFSEKTESTFGPVHMVNKFIVMITEGFSGANGFANLLKSLVSQDGGSFAVKNGKPYEVDKTTVGIQGCGNTDLLCDDSGGGWSRRMVCAEMPATASKPRATLAGELKQLELGRIIYKVVLLYFAGIKATGFKNGPSREHQTTAAAKFWGPCNKSASVDPESFAAWNIFARLRPDGIAPKAFDEMKSRVTSRNHPLTNALTTMRRDRGRYYFADSLPEWDKASRESGQQFCKAPALSNGQIDVKKISSAKEKEDDFIFSPVDALDVMDQDCDANMESAPDFMNILYMPFDDKKDVGFMQMVQSCCNKMDLDIKMALKRNEQHWWTGPLAKFNVYKVECSLPWPIGQRSKWRRCEWIINCSSKKCFVNEKTNVQYYPSVEHKVGTNTS